MALDLQKDNNHLMIFKKQIISLAKACIGWRFYNLRSKLLVAGVLRIYELGFCHKTTANLNEELSKIGLLMEKNVWGADLIFTKWGM